uniref:Uncharacterized protein n=1 Tax=Knipowitschia caucasica TaxID=637954 RepID=A0AAV2MQV9_KNICA
MVRLWEHKAREKNWKEVEENRRYDAEEWNGETIEQAELTPVQKPSFPFSPRQHPMMLSLGKTSWIWLMFCSSPALHDCMVSERQLTHPSCTD